LKAQLGRSKTHVLSCRDPDRPAVDLAVEIHTAQFAEYPVTVAAVLSGFSARPLAPLLFLLTGNVERAARAREPGTLVHFGPGNTVPARKGVHSTRSSEGSICWGDTSTRANDHHPCRTLAISRRKVHEPAGEEKGRVRRGAGGDHDLPYRFTLPTSMPQVLAWVKLLARVELRAFQPEVGAEGSRRQQHRLPSGPSTPTYAPYGKNLAGCAARSDKE
jgi:hypothetical protein